MAMTAHLIAEVHANFKYICGKQETKKEKELSRKSIIVSEERVWKITAVITPSFTERKEILRFVEMNTYP